MALSASDSLKAQGLATAVQLLTGSRPRVDNNGDHYLITPTAEQATALRKILAAWWDSAPGTVRVNVKPVLVPFVLQKALPYIIGAAVLGGVAFIMLKKG